MPGSWNALPQAKRALLAIGLLAFLTQDVAVFAQAVSPEQLQMLQLQQQAGRQPAVPDLPSSTIVQPDQLGRPPQDISRLEEIMSQRAGTQLRLFGRNALGGGRAVTIAQAGGVQDDYVLGPGDEVLVQLRGQENSETRTQVSRDGQVMLPRLNPIAAAGRSFGSFRQDIEAAVRRGYVATNAFVSLGRLRQISVMVAGEVNNPGQRTLPGLASVVDAILISGGIRASGSLRNVHLQRGGRDYVIDLYSVISGNGRRLPDMRLADGDRIIVPILGPTVAIAGLVRQPAIYELPPGQRGIDAAGLIAQAGGEEVRGLYRLSVLRIGADGLTNYVDVGDPKTQVRDSEVLFVQSGADKTFNRATLSGGTALAGNFPITAATKLSSILQTPGALGLNPYTLFGVVVRRDPQSLLRALYAFTPSAVLRGTEDMALQPDDIVRVISVDETVILGTAVRDYIATLNIEQEAIRNPLARGATIANANNALASVVATSGNTGDAAVAERQSAQAVATRPTGGSTGDAPLTAPGRGNALNFQEQTTPAAPGSANREGATLGQIARQIGVDTLVFTNFLRDHEVTLRGAVQGPGAYLVGPNATLQDLIAAAGGLSNWADTSNVEVISTTVEPASGRALTNVSQLTLKTAIGTNYVVKPRDEFQFREVFNDAGLGSVTLQGEVRFAGAYRLTRGERVSDLLARAGGLTNGAYPYGAIFLRKSAALQEQESYLRLAKEVQDQFLLASTRSSSGQRTDESAAFSAMQALVADLRSQKALGRIAVPVDPSVLAAHPEQDASLEAGDVIYIPPRPSTVAVLGQVSQPGSFAYSAGMTVKDYIERAGGYGRFADDSEVFVVLPDGSARRIEKSWLRLSSNTALPPGSAIVVPRDISPLDVRALILDVTQVLSSLATSLASIAILSKQ